MLCNYTHKKSSKLSFPGEEKLAQFKLIIDQAPYGIALSDLKGTLIYLNDFIATMHGYTVPELIGNNLEIFHTEEQMQTVRRLHGHLIKHGNFTAEEVWHVRKDGSTFPTLMTATVIRDSFGTPLYLLATAIDITEIKRKENDITQTRDFLENILKASTDGILITDPKGVITMTNSALENMLGYSGNELRGKHCSSLSLRDETYQTRATKIFSRIKTEGAFSSHEDIWVKKDGTPIFIEISISLVKDPKGIIQGAVGMVRDITSRKAIEGNLHKREQELRIMNKIASIFLTIGDEKMYDQVLDIILDVVQSMSGFFGYINEEGNLICPPIKGKRWDQLPSGKRMWVFTPREWFHTSWGRAILTKQTIIMNTPAQVPKGHLPIDREIATPILYQGEAVGIFVLGNKTTDYTDQDKKLLETIASYVAPILHARLERDRKEKERRRAELEIEKFKTMCDQANYGVVIANLDGTISYVNERFTQMFGYSQEEICGKNLSFFHGEKASQRLEVLLYDAVSRSSTEPIEIEHLRKDGTSFPSLLSAGVITDSEGNPYLLTATIVDIANIKMLEAMLCEVNQCLLSFGTDPGKNIARIIKTTSALFRDGCILYNRLEGDFLCTVAGYNIHPVSKGKTRSMVTSATM